MLKNLSDFGKHSQKVYFRPTYSSNQISLPDLSSEPDRKMLNAKAGKWMTE
jgi:hypothetical protein